ncbi:MAG TPA: hypothetical protein VFW85_06890, partial [Gaiellaceae bacterium]|nr:hypothetical protein [Gaiellaceae bacterium]
MRIAIDVLSGITLAYFLVLNSIYVGFTAVAWRRLTAHLRATDVMPVEEILTSELTPGVSVLVPAYNEAFGI